MKFFTSICLALLCTTLFTAFGMRHPRSKVTITTSPEGKKIITTKKCKKQKKQQRKKSDPEALAWAQVLAYTAQLKDFDPHHKPK